MCREREIKGHSLEQCSLTGGKQSSLAISVFLILPASSRDKPLTRSVMYELDAIALPHPKVLNLTSEMIPFSSTRIWSFMTSPQLQEGCRQSRQHRVLVKKMNIRRSADEASTDIEISLGERSHLEKLSDKHLGVFFSTSWSRHTFLGLS